MLEVVDYRAMGDRLRERRRAMKLTQEELAERIDISASFVGQLERAEKPPLAGYGCGSVRGAGSQHGLARLG